MLWQQRHQQSNIQKIGRGPSALPKKECGAHGRTVMHVRTHLVQALHQSRAEQDGAVAVGLEVDAHVKLLCGRMQVLNTRRRHSHLALQLLLYVCRRGAVRIRRLYNAHLQCICHPCHVHFCLAELDTSPGTTQSMQTQALPWALGWLDACEIVRALPLGGGWEGTITGREGRACSADARALCLLFC